MISSRRQAENSLGKERFEDAGESHIKKIEESSMYEFKSQALHQRLRSVFCNLNTRMNGTTTLFKRQLKFIKLFHKFFARLLHFFHFKLLLKLMSMYTVTERLIEYQKKILFVPFAAH